MILQKSSGQADTLGFPRTSLENKIFRRFVYGLCGGAFFAMLCVILYLVYAFVATSLGKGDHSWLLGIFSDFVEIMNASLSESPYLANGESYPPIAIMVLYPFSLICKNVFALYAHEKGLTVNDLTARVILHAEFWVALLLFFVLSIGIILLLLFLKYKPAPKAMFKMGAAITCSAPFAYAIMRGNTIYFALIFSLLFLLLYEHPNPIVREISYFCLVFAGAIKIYPLFFGVFLLRKKKFFPAIRIALYSGIIFLISFGFFSDGMDSFFVNLGGFMTSDERLLSLRNLSLTSLIFKLFYWISPSATESLGFSIVHWGAIGIIFVLSTVLALVTRSDFSRSVIVSSVVILIPSISYFYVLIFMVIPLMEYWNHCEEFSEKKRKGYGILFFCLFFTPFIIPQFYIPHALIVLALWGSETVSVFRNECLPHICKKSASRKPA